MQTKSHATLPAAEFPTHKAPPAHLPSCDTGNHHSPQGRTNCPENASRRMSQSQDSEPVISQGPHASPVRLGYRQFGPCWGNSPPLYAGEHDSWLKSLECPHAGVPFTSTIRQPSTIHLLVYGTFVHVSRWTCCLFAGASGHVPDAGLRIVVLACSIGSSTPDSVLKRCGCNESLKPNVSGRSFNPS